MAGPVLTIFMRPQLTDDLAEEIGDWIENRLALGKAHKGQDGPFPATEGGEPRLWPNWDFHAAVDFPRQARGGQWRPLTLGLAPFGGEPGTEFSTPRGWLDFASSNLGFVPGFQAGLSCGSNQPEDHRVAGQIALAIAEWLGGTIALNIDFAPETLETMLGQYVYASGAYNAERWGWDFCELGLADTTWMRAYLDSARYYLRK